MSSVRPTIRTDGFRPQRALALVPLLLSAAFSSSSAVGEDSVGDDPVSTLRDRMVAAFCLPSGLSNASIANMSSLAVHYASSLLPNGTWGDVNYTDYYDRTIWKTSAHLDRVQIMAQALSLPNSPTYNNDSLFASTRLALNAAFTNDWQNANWWFMIIWEPQIVSSIFLLLDLLPPSPGRLPSFPTSAELDYAFTFSVRAAWWNASLGYEVTGANLAWMIQAQLLRAVWPSNVNTSALDQGFARLWQEVKIVPSQGGYGGGQGIQYDGTFHMHGPQLQIASYGQDYTVDMLAFIAIATGLPQYELPSDTAQFLCFFLANGMSWSSTGPSIDWSASGRQMDRNTWFAENSVSLNTASVRMFASTLCNSSTSQLVLDFADRVDLRANATPLVGNRFFWESDYAVHRRPGWVAAWHGHSNRTTINECGNGENLLGVYEAQGVVNLFSLNCSLEGGESIFNTPLTEGPVGWGCGAEYAGIFPILDWKNLNGATSLADESVLPCPSPQCCWISLVTNGSRHFTGGSSDGMYGMTAMDTVYSSLIARKANFFFDSAIVSLGFNVTNFHPQGRLRTALASRFLYAPGPSVSVGLAANYSTAYSVLPDGNYTFPAGDTENGLVWAHADGVGWMTVVPGASSTPPGAALWAGKRSEPWETIGVYPGNMTGRTISLGIDHGTYDSPPQGETYAYMTLPQAPTPQDVMAAAGDVLGVVGVDPKSIVNTADVQGAVQFLPSASKTTPAVVGEAVFWNAPANYSWVMPTTAAAVSGLPLAFTLSVDTPCFATYSLTITGSSSALATIAIAGPQGAGAVVGVTLALPGWKPGGRCTPGGPGGQGLQLSYHLPSDVDHIGQSVVMSCEMAVVA